jgi:hypothetical protein
VSTQRSNIVQQTFTGGEVSPLMQARTDTPLYKKAVSKSLNFLLLPQGASRFRNGTQLITNTKQNHTGRLVPFMFSDLQAFVLEFTNLKLRFYKDGNLVLRTAVNIASVTAANPASVNAPAHGYSTGDEVYITGVTGMPQVNGRFYLVNVTDVNNFTLSQLDGTSVNTSFVSGTGSDGTAAKPYEIASPYAEADIPLIQYDQNWNTMFLFHQKYATRTLIRTTDTSWAFATVASATWPFGADNSGNCPGSGGFTADGRLCAGGTINHPETFWESDQPVGVNTAFTTFTSGIYDTNSTVFTFAPLGGKTDAIQWIKNNTKFLAFGGFGNARAAYGINFDNGVTPTAINVKSISNLGSERIMPVVAGHTLMYVQRGGSVLRSVEYDFYNAQYVSKNRSQAADHLTNGSTITQIVQQQGAQTTGNPDCVWAVRSDGKLLGLTFDAEEQISGWHSHQLGGQYQDATSKVVIPHAKVICAAIMLRPSGGDQVYLMVERYINNAVVRTVEYFADQPPYPNRADYFTGDKEADTQNFNNYLWEVQKRAIHLDMAVAYDGSALGANATVSLIPSSVTGSNITLDSAVITGTTIAPVITPTSIFTPDIVGKQIWKAYDVNGGGGGRCEVITYVSPTQVIANVLSDFDTTDAMSPGNWLIAVTEVWGLNHLEGNTVQVCADGGAHKDLVVMNGGITLDYFTSKVNAGLFSVGVHTGMNLDSGGVTGPAESKIRSVYKGMIRYLNTSGASFGTSPYEQEQLTFYDPLTGQLDRPPSLFTGIKKYTYCGDTYDEFDKRITILQTLPLPCTILAVDAFMTTGDA